MSALPTLFVGITTTFSSYSKFINKLFPKKRYIFIGILPFPFPPKIEVEFVGTG